jgi:hypothetical protein
MFPCPDAGAVQTNVAVDKRLLFDCVTAALYGNMSKIIFFKNLMLNGKIAPSAVI